MEITFFDNGVTLAFEGSQQVPIAQEPWIILYAKYLESLGIDPTEHTYKLPNGARAKVFRVAGDEPGEISYNWELDKF